MPSPEKRKLSIPSDARVTPVRLADAKAHAGVWLWVLAVAVVASLGIWVGQWGPMPHSDDWAQYLMHAQALAEGRSYTDILYIFSHYAWGTGPPIAAPGLPLAMAPIIGAVGFHQWMHVGLSLPPLLALMAIVGVYFGRYNPRRAATAALVLGTGLVLIRGADTLQPDLPFAALIWGTLLLADSEEQWTWARTVGIALVGLWAVLFRVAALPLIPAMLAFGVLTWKTHKLRPFLIGAVWILAAAFLFFVVESGRMPPPEFYIEIPPDSSDGEPLLSVILKNIVNYRFSAFESQLYPFASGALNDVYHVLITLVMVVGLFVWLENSWYRFGAVFAVAYLGMLLVAPVWTGRYLWPLWPLSAYGVVAGLDTLLDRIPSERIPRNGFRSAAVMVPIVFMAIAVGVSEQPDPSIYRLDPVEEVVEYMATLPSEDPRVVFFMPRSFAWTTGLPTMALFSAPSNEAVLRELSEKRISHVVVGILGHPELIGGLERWTSTVRTYPELFEPVFENDDFTVYEVQSES